MFVVANIVGSTIQITTLPLPVLSTLQAVRILVSAYLFLLTLSVRPRLQLNMRFYRPQRALHAILLSRNRTRRNRRTYDWHFRLYQ